MEQRRRLSPVALAAIAAALLLGVLVGISTGLADRIFGGAKPETIATASLESMRAQNRLIAFVARYVSVTSSRTSRFGFSAERTLILPGDVRYELDLSKLQPKDVSWDAGSQTLRVQLPDVEIAGPEVDLPAAREYGEGGLLAAVTNSGQQLDQANRARAVQDLRKQAAGEVPMGLARQAARAAVERSFAMPLQAAGFTNAKVVARFPTEGSDDPSYLDRSVPYEEAIRKGRERRAAEGQK
jgi:hypothetical protein